MFETGESLTLPNPTPGPIAEPFILPNESYPEFITLITVFTDNNSEGILDTNRRAGLGIQHMKGSLCNVESTNRPLKTPSSPSTSQFPTLSRGHYRHVANYAHVGTIQLMYVKRWGPHSDRDIIVISMRRDKEILVCEGSVSSTCY